MTVTSSSESTRLIPSALSLSEVSSSAKVGAELSSVKVGSAVGYKVG